MFSQLLRFKLVDKLQNSAKLSDLSVAVLDEDYPPVTNLFFLDEGQKLKKLNWEAVAEIDFKRRRIMTNDLRAAEDTSPAEVGGEVLLRNDILDALILDLLNRTITRANDLILRIENDEVRLQGADTGFGAMWRRISRGIFNRINKDSLCDWKYLEFLRGDPDAVDNGAGYHLRINRLPAGEIAQLADFLPYLHIAELLTLLPDPKAADVLEALPINRQLQVIEEFEETQAIQLLSLMSPDLAADLIRRLQPSAMKHYLESMPKKQSERIIELLCYPEDSVGGVMVNDVIYISANITVSEARERLRERLKEPDFVSLIFLVDDEETRKLTGVISLRQLMVSDDNQKLEEIMDPYLEIVHPLDSAQQAAYRILGAQLAAMPVTSKDGKLLGVMTIDAAIKQIAWSTADMQLVRIFS